MSFNPGTLEPKLLSNFYLFLQGDYEAKVTLSNGSTVLACYDFKVSLKTSSKDEQYHNDVEITV